MIAKPLFLLSGTPKDHRLLAAVPRAPRILLERCLAARAPLRAPANSVVERCYRRIYFPSNSNNRLGLRSPRVSRNLMHG